MHKVLVTDPISDRGLTILTNAGVDVVYNPVLSSEELMDVVKDVHGWIIRSGTTVTFDHLKQAKNLLRNSNDNLRIALSKVS